MNLNILAYAFYFGITAFITLRVGWLFYHYGANYLYELYPQQQELADSLNRILLIGYYLLNLGHIAHSLHHWPLITSELQMIELLSQKTGFICLVLGVIHFANMLWVRLWKKI